jgi:hypothetical protein
MQPRFCSARRSGSGGGGRRLLLLLLAAAAGAVGAVRETKYYDALGVSADADDRTIQKAYRRQAL